MAQLSPTGPVLVVAQPGDTQDAILSAVAAQQLDAEVITEPEQLGALWRTAASVLIDADQAGGVAARALPHRSGVYVVGEDPTLLSTWSAPLAARVILLPEGAAWLGAVLGEGSQRRAPVVAAIGGSGGVGTSTLAVTIAQLSAAQTPLGAALVDADPFGGGIDLLLGAEGVAGWRWPRLSSAAGQLGDLRSYLPVIDKVSVLSMARGEQLDLAREPLAAIVNSLAGWHSLVVIDPGRCDIPVREAVRLSSIQLVVVSAAVRAVAAARQVIAAHELTDACLVVRQVTGGLPGSVVADALQLPVLAEVPTDSRLPGASERGVPPLSAAGRRYRRALSGLVAQLEGSGDA